jgi:hypothetical protein
MDIVRLSVQAEPSDGHIHYDFQSAVELTCTFLSGSYW